MGLLAWLQEKGSYWLGSWRSSPDAAEELSHERVKAKIGGMGGKFWYLPWVDSLTQETPGMRRAYRLMLSDPTVKAALWSKIFRVAALEPQVNAPDESDRSKTGADFISHCVKRARNQVRGFAESILTGGLIDGYSICEKIVEVETRGPFAGKVVLKALKAKDPDTLMIEGDEYKNITSIIGRQYNAGMKFDPSHFVIWQHMPIYESPTGMSDLRAAYRAYWMVDTAWKLRAVHLEKYTSPMLKGTYTNAGTQKDQLEQALEDAKSSTWISVPAGVMVEAFELSQRGTADFRDAIKDLQAEIMLGITGAILQALEGAITGARSIGEVHKSTADLIIWYLADCLGDALTAQVIPDLIDLNYAGMDYPTLTFGGVDDTQLQPSLAIDKGLQEMGVDLSKKALYKRYRREAPLDEADKVSPPQTGQQPGGMMPFDEGGEAVVARPFSETTAEYQRLLRESA